MGSYARLQKSEIPYVSTTDVVPFCREAKHLAKLWRQGPAWLCDYQLPTLGNYPGLFGIIRSVIIHIYRKPASEMTRGDPLVKTRIDT